MRFTETMRVALMRLERDETLSKGCGVRLSTLLALETRGLATVILGDDGWQAHSVPRVNNHVPSQVRFTTTPDREPSPDFNVLAVNEIMEEVATTTRPDATVIYRQARELVPVEYWDREYVRYVNYLESFRNAAQATLGATPASFIKFTREAVKKIRDDASDFVRSHWSDLENLDPQKTAEDYILSRNTLGRGFFWATYGSHEQRSRLDMAASLMGKQMFAAEPE